MPDTLPTDKLAQLIDAKRDVLEQLRQLARRQCDLIAGNDMASLMTVLAAKESLLRRLLALEKDIDPFRPEDPDARQWRSAELRRRCRQSAERCEALLAELMLLEKQGESELQKRRDETAARLDGAHAALQARRAYIVSPPGSPTSLDLSSEG